MRSSDVPKGLQMAMPLRVAPSMALLMSLRARTRAHCRSSWGNAVRPLLAKHSACTHTHHEVLHEGLIFGRLPASMLPDRESSIVSQSRRCTCQLFTRQHIHKHVFISEGAPTCMFRHHE